MKKVHLDEWFPGILFLTLLLFALPELPVSSHGTAALKVIVGSAALYLRCKWRDFKWILNAGAVEELQQLERDSC